MKLYKKINKQSKNENSLYPPPGFYVKTESDIYLTQRQPPRTFISNTDFKRKISMPKINNKNDTQILRK